MTAKKLIRNVMAAFIVALAIILAVVIFRGVEESKMVEEPSEPAPQTKVDVTLQKVRYTETSEGVRKWTLVADGVEYWREKEMSRLENVEITFYRQDSDNDVILTAREGKFHLESREVQLWGDVHLQTEDGTTFRSERAFYSDQTRRISSPGKVHLTSAGMDIDAVGMRYYLDTRQLKLLSEVEAEIVAGDIAENGK